MKKNILIIEGHYDTAEILADLMQFFNYDYELARDVMPVPDVLKTRPDLIIIDQKLSNGLGSILCHKLKTTPASRHIPVIITSAALNLAEIAEQCGADDYMHKPFDIDGLRAKLIKLLSKG